MERGIINIKHEAMPATGRGDPQGSKTSRPTLFLENRFTDGAFFRPYAPTALYPRKFPGTDSGTSGFQVHAAAEWIRSNEHFNGFLGNRTSDRPICNIMPQLC
jgi:hypothetical protein